MLRSTSAKSPCTNRVGAAAPAANRSKYDLGVRVAVDGDVAAAARAAAGSSSAAWPPAPKVQSTTVSPGPQLEQVGDLLRHHRNVVGHVRATAVREIRQHPRHSPRIPLPGFSTPRDPRSRGGRADPATTMSRSSWAWASWAGGIMIRPWRSTSTSAAPAYRWRLIVRPCLLNGSSRPIWASVKDSQPVPVVHDQDSCSIPLLITAPSVKCPRSLAGSVTRFFASSF